MALRSPLARGLGVAGIVLGKILSGLPGLVIIGAAPVELTITLAK